MANKWVLFVKKWAAKKGMSYGCALSQPQLKTDYRKAYPTKQQERFRDAVERGEMGDEDVRSQAVRTLGKEKQKKKKPDLIIESDSEEEIFNTRRSAKMFYPSWVYISKEDYFEYIAEYSPKKVDNFFKKMKDNSVGCWLITLSNPRGDGYDELWLFDIKNENNLTPVLIQGINGSSKHALWSNSLGDDDDNDEGWDLEKLIRMVGDSWREGLRKVMERDYINKK